MITYNLIFSSGFSACGDEFVNLDDARDVAFSISEESGGAEVQIFESFGVSSNLIETVFA